MKELKRLKEKITNSKSNGEAIANLLRYALALEAKLSEMENLALIQYLDGLKAGYWTFGINGDELGYNQAYEDIRSQIKLPTPPTQETQ